MHLIKAPPGIRPGPVRDLDVAVRALLRFWRGLSERERLHFAEMFYRALPEDDGARDLEVALARYGAGLLHRYRAALLGNGSTVVLTFPEDEDQPAVIDAGVVQTFLEQVAREAGLPHVSIAWRVVERQVVRLAEQFDEPARATGTDGKP